MALNMVNNIDEGIELDIELARHQNLSDEWINYPDTARLRTAIEGSSATAAYCLTGSYIKIGKKLFCTSCVNNTLIPAPLRPLGKHTQFHYSIPEGFDGNHLKCNKCNGRMCIIAVTDVCIICNNVRTLAEKAMEQPLAEQRRRSELLRHRFPQRADREQTLDP
jgi:hypothetical protein